MLKQLALIITLIQLTTAVLQEQESKHQCLDANGHPVCMSPECIHTASRILRYIDEDIDPCDDFYKFACGGFLKKTAIPEEKPSVGSFNIIGDKILKQLKLAIEEPSVADEPKTFTLVKRFYNVCMDTAAIEDDNLQSAKSIITWLGGWPVLDGSQWKEEDFDWKQTMFKFRRVGLTPNSLFDIYVGKDTQNSSLRIVDCDEVTLGLDRDYLVKGLENEFVSAYYNYLVDVAVSFGAEKSKALEELKASVEFEIELAGLALPKEERRDMAALTNVMTVEELQSKYPIVPWVEYISSVIATPGIKIAPSESIDVGVPKFLTTLEALLERTPKRVLANYLISRAVLSGVSYLTKELRDRELQYNQLFKGNVNMEPRWLECVKNAVSELNIATAALYVRKYFNTEVINSASNLVKDLREAFKGLLQKVDWMDEATKEKAIIKALEMGSYIGCPSEFFDDKKLEEYHDSLQHSPDNYLKLSLNIQKFKLDNSFKVLREVVNKTDWLQHWRAATVNAFYDPTENAIQIAAGILQGVFFNSNRPQYMNYGSMGFAIGHEITHGFDDTGKQYDEDGNLIDWWGEATAKAYLEKARCIIEQYGNYTYPGIEINLNGINTQGENIADNGGVREAYLAYKSWVERNGEEPLLPGLNYTSRQLFWISMSHVWCSKERKEHTASDIVSNTHSPAYFRVVGSLSNSEQFSKDFECPEGSRMNPKHKCQVW